MPISSVSSGVSTFSFCSFTENFCSISRGCDGGVPETLPPAYYVSLPSDLAETHRDDSSWVYGSLPSGPPTQVHSLGVEPSLHEKGAVSQATDGEQEEWLGGSKCHPGCAVNNSQR